MVLAKVLDSIFQKSFPIVRNMSFRRNVPLYLKCSTWFRTNIRRNMNIESNKKYEKAKDQKTKETKEIKNYREIKKNDKKNDKHNGKEKLVEALLRILVIGSLIVSITSIMYLPKFMSGFPEVYLYALIHCRKNPTIVDVLGKPINIVQQKNCIERTHNYYKKDGVTYEKFTLDIEGPKAKGLMEAIVKQDDNNKYQYVELHVIVPKVGIFKVEPNPANLLEEHSKWTMFEFNRVGPRIIDS